MSMCAVRGREREAGGGDGGEKERIERGSGRQREWMGNNKYYNVL
jgi:hypothetical protein